MNFVWAIMMKQALLYERRVLHLPTGRVWVSLTEFCEIIVRFGFKILCSVELRVL